DRGIAFYRKLVPVIKKGKTVFHGPKVCSYRHPKGWQGIFRESGDQTKAFLLLHGFYDATGEEIKIPVPDRYRIADIYSYKDEDVLLENGVVSYVFDEDMKAVCLYLEKE
ncbi:MAG: alpha-galactosidase, partial [Lachnospiraceae bacterium]|nr:alpha-galactosidase [Lachnospiraceae bacterium]